MTASRDMEEMSYEEVVHYVTKLIRRNRPFSIELVKWIQERHPSLVLPDYVRQGYKPEVFPL